MSFHDFSNIPILTNIYKFSCLRVFKILDLKLFFHNFTSSYSAATAKKHQAQKRTLMLRKNLTMVAAVQFPTTPVPAAAGFAQKKTEDKSAIILAKAESE